MYRLHARVCGLLARVGLELGLIPDIGRRYPIEPLLGKSGRRQLQAEADVSFIDPETDEPVVLLDYETSDAPVFKMRNKFNYLSTFAKFSGTVKVVGLLITVTDVQHDWDPRETRELRRQFATVEIIELINELYQRSHNDALVFLLGTFWPDHLQLCLFERGKRTCNEVVQYG